MLRFTPVRLIRGLGAALVCAVMLVHPAGADEVGSSGCGLPLHLRGDVNHYSVNRAVNGATSPDMYRDEIYGTDFTVEVNGLPPGTYEVEIYMAEMYATQPGQRVFTIRTLKEVLAENLDLFAEVGADTEHVVRALVQHEGDSIQGPLTLEFKSSVNNAKFNAITIKDSGGHVVACSYAIDFQNEDELWASQVPVVEGPVLYTDTSQPFEVRVDDLVRRMSLKEKVNQLVNSAPAIERLGVPAYDYWNECLHGVARAGQATVFPQAIALAAMWDTDMLGDVADTIATEARAKNNAARAQNPNTRRYFGLTFWTPNINIFRDPRWGRGHETYGEDPFLTGRLAVAFIRGLQGDDPKYLKAMACAKHFAVHSGPEKLRHHFNAVATDRDLYETYLPQFEMAVTEGKVGIVMSVYNAVAGVPGPASHFLLTEILRERWGFEGHVVSDCGAVRDIWANHKYVETAEEASALAIKAGNDLNCGSTYLALAAAVRQGLVTEEEIDTALKRTMLSRFQLGLFDSPEECAFLNIPASANMAPEHSRLALEAARKSIVLLKNESVLPLDRSKVGTIAVIGANADSVDALLGNYNGDPADPVTVLRGIRERAGEGIEIRHAVGSPLALRPNQRYSVEDQMAQEALAIAREADVIVYVGGLDAHLEGEEMPTNYVGFDGGDRVSIELPKPQLDLLRALAETGKPLVFVNMTGSAVALEGVEESIPAIVQAWYPGQSGGHAVADVLFGDVNPGGRLPVTFYRSTADLPEFTDYSMENRTYRYFRGEPLFVFGHGLSYTTFEYGKPSVSAEKWPHDGTIELTVPVTNAGDRDGDEVVQVYVRHIDSPVPQPIKSLAGFDRVTIARGETAELKIELPSTVLRYWDEEKGEYVVPTGRVEIQIGASSADIRQTIKMEVI